MKFVIQNNERKMNTMVKFVAALLIVFSAAVSSATVDSASLAAFCKVLDVEDGKHFRVLYQSPETVNVQIQIFDKYNRKVHQEMIYKTDGFAKDFDLGNLPQGEYTFDVRSKAFNYEQEVELVDVVAHDNDVQPLYFQISSVEGKVAVTGQNVNESALRVVLKDQEGNILYREKVGSDETLTRLYNLDKVRGSSVSVQIFSEGKVIKESEFKI